MNVTSWERRRFWVALGFLSAGLIHAAAVRPALAHPALVIDHCDDVSSWQTSGEVALSSVAGPEDGSSALKLTFTTDQKEAPAFGWRRFRGQGLWDLPKGGVSFWMKGDGSDGFFEVEVVDTSFKLRYAALVPLADPEWHKVSIPWREFVPELYHAQFHPWPVMHPEGGIKPHAFWSLFIGRWFYFLHHFKPYEITIDEITAEESLPFDDTDYTPAEPGIPRTLAKLRAKEPVTIVCTGDSITYGVGAGGPPGAYPGKLEALLRQRFGYTDIRVVNSGVGGLMILQGSVLIPRDVAPHEPDLVTVLYGYNDLASGVAQKDQFKVAVAVFVDRVRRHTKGKAEVMLITSLPGTSDEAWERLEAGAEAVREVAEEKRCSSCDASAPFRALGREALITDYFRTDDPAHPNAEGQDLLARLLLDAIVGK